MKWLTTATSRTFILDPYWLQVSSP